MEYPSLHLHFFKIFNDTRLLLLKSLIQPQIGHIRYTDAGPHHFEHHGAAWEVYAVCTPFWVISAPVVHQMLRLLWFSEIRILIRKWVDHAHFFKFIKLERFPLCKYRRIFIIKLQRDLIFLAWQHLFEFGAMVK